MPSQLDHRRERYFKLSSAIAQLDNEQLQSLFAESEAEAGWGRNHVIEVAGAKLFVKRIPVTDLEVANQFSTRNLYELPTYYNYGVGSAGFGLFRELITHIKTTNWVLAGEIENFPLLYHYRIIPAMEKDEGKHGGVNLAEHKEHVAYWNNSETVSKFILERANAKQEALLFLEYFPHTLEAWLLENPDKLEMAIADVRATIAFLRQNSIIHFDTDWSNILADGERAYLSDFGLTLDRSFALSPEEAAFFDQHRSYDDGLFLSEIDFHLVTRYRKLPDDPKSKINQKYGLGNESKFDEIAPILLNNIEEIAAQRLMPLAPSYLATVVQYREIILLVAGFYAAMRGNPQKNTKFDHERLTQLLQATGYLISPTLS